MRRAVEWLDLGFGRFGWVFTLLSWTLIAAFVIVLVLLAP